MKRCPSCLDDHVDDATVCGSCGVELGELDETGLLRGAGTAATDEVRLGRFHPAVAGRIAKLLHRRAIGHTVIPRDDDAEVRIDADWRDDIRAELTLTWSEVIGGLDPETAAAVRAGGGRSPGWFDAPEGGYIDRAGRLVVSATEDDAEEARVIGPALLTGGAILGVVGWYVVDSTGVLTIGVALAVIGLFTPR